MIDPALRITSRAARATWVWPCRRYSTPTATLPSNRIRVTVAFVTSRSFAFFNAGRR